MGRKVKLRQWKLRRVSARRLRRRLARMDPAGGRRKNAFRHLVRKDRVFMPEVISLWTPLWHEELTNAMARLRGAFVGHGSVHVDFSSTERLHAEGMLLFYAELTRLIAAFPDRELSCRPSRTLKVSHVLQHLGIYKLFNYTAPEEPEGDDVVLWRSTRAKDVNVTEAGRLIEEQPSLSPAQTGVLFKSVSEAVTNVSHHSHLAERLDQLNLPPAMEWWMFSREVKDRLYIAVCDLGIGIPRSLPRVHTMEKVMEAISRIFKDKRPTDGRMIHAALRLRRSRTEQDNRGLGFADILQVINQVDGSELTIYSNRGSLTYKADQIRPSIKTRTFKNSILGTILVWGFPLTGE